MTTYYMRQPQTQGRPKTIHKKRGCKALKRALGIASIVLTPEQLKTKKRCRYCFPEEGEHGQDHKRP